MAFATILHESSQAQETVTVTATTATDNDTYDFKPAHPMRAMSFHAQGSSFGAGTASLQGSNDGTNFFALPTAATTTANAIKSVSQADLGYKWYRIELTGATDPTLTIIVNMCYNQ